MDLAGKVSRIADVVGVNAGVDVGGNVGYADLVLHRRGSSRLQIVIRTRKI
jgi:hypothetical protein